MGVPTSEVGCTTAMPRREDHEVHKDMWWHWIKKKLCRVQFKCDGTRWRTEGETGEWSGYPVLFTLPQNIVNPELLPLMRKAGLPVVDWTDAPADLNGLVHFAERRNLVSARVPSHFKCSLPVPSYCPSLNSELSLQPPGRGIGSHPMFTILGHFLLVSDTIAAKYVLHISGKVLPPSE
jgi:hypothetical protein